MNETLAAFILSRPEGLLDSTDVQTLVHLDPFCTVTVLCRDGVLQTPAKDCAHFVSLLERDDREEILAVTIPEATQREAQAWRKVQEWPVLPVIKPITTKLATVPEHAMFEEGPCGAVQCGIRGNYE